MSRVYDKALAPSGVNVSQLAILRAIGRAGESGVALSRLAETMVMDSTSLYRTLGPLQRSGWVEINPAPKGRTKVVTLSAFGREVTDAAADYWDDVQMRVVEAFGPERWAAIHSAIADLTAVGVRLAA